MPSIFGEDMFDEFMRGFPFFDNSAENNVEKKLYGHNAKNVMKPISKSWKAAMSWRSIFRDSRKRTSPQN